MVLNRNMGNIVESEVTSVLATISIREAVSVCDPL